MLGLWLLDEGEMEAGRIFMPSRALEAVRWSALKFFRFFVYKTTRRGMVMAMVRIDEAPKPTVNSDRKVGLELEIDVGYNNTREGVEHDIQGWTRKHDGSLDNGWEFVFDGPVLIRTALERIERFCSVIRDVNVHQSGGFHVHVQGDNYSREDCFSLAKLYRSFQGVINKLVGPSRVNNEYCRPYEDSEFVSIDRFIDRYQLGMVTRNRDHAKDITSRYHVINMNMMTVENPIQRSLEFRQGSVSKRVAVIFGWMSFVTALTEAAKDHEAVNNIFHLRHRQLNLECVLDFFRAYEARSGSEKVADWIKWRYDYLNQEPTDEVLSKAEAAICADHLGLFGLSRVLDANLPFCRRVIEKLVDSGRIIKRPGKAFYVSAEGYGAQAKSDLDKMVAALKAQRATREVAVEQTN